VPRTYKLEVLRSGSGARELAAAALVLAFALVARAFAGHF
jgi:hypothetical protein